MATSPDLATQAVNITSDFEDFLESFKIEDIDDEDELAEYVSKIGNIKKVFRRIYAQLKLSEGEGFSAKFPNYERELKEINETFQEGNKKLTGLRKAAKEKIDAGDKLRNVLETEKLRQEMIALQNVAEETSVNYCGPAINCNGLIITQLNLKVNWQTKSGLI